MKHIHKDEHEQAPMTSTPYSSSRPDVLCVASSSFFPVSRSWSCTFALPTPIHYLRVLVLRVCARRVRRQLACQSRILLLQGARVAGGAVIVALERVQVRDALGELGVRLAQLDAPLLGAAARADARRGTPTTQDKKER